MPMPDATTPLTHAWATTPVGPVHYVTAGSGRPVLLLHQTPRSWDEYRDVIPLLAEHHQVLAMDSLGFGETPKPDEPLTIELLARGAAGLIEALGVGPVAVVGHHTGGIVATELAARHGHLVSSLVLSSTPLIDAAWRERVGSAPRIDAVTPAIEGGHLVDLWEGRRPFYPEDRIDLLERFVVDALRASWAPGDGHGAVQTFRMEERIGDITAPALLLAPTDDPFVYEDVPLLAEALGAEIREVEGGMIPLPDHMPETFASIVLEWLARQPESQR